MSNTIQVKITKSSIPIMWIDTSIIIKMTQWKYNLCKLDQLQIDRVSKLYNQIIKYTRAGKLICPFAEQESEIWVERDKWLDVINSLSLGIEAVSLLTIFDNQMSTFMKAYIDNTFEILLSYNDAFYEDPVKELKEILKAPIFITVNSSILFGEDYQKSKKSELHKALNEQREKNVQNKVTFDKQLEEEFMGELKVLHNFKQKFLTGDFENKEDRFNAAFGTIDLNHKLMMWDDCTGKSNDYLGFEDFCKSEYYKAMPYTNISCNLFAKLLRPTNSRPLLGV